MINFFGEVAFGTELIGVFLSWVLVLTFINIIFNNLGGMN